MKYLYRNPKGNIVVRKPKTTKRTIRRTSSPYRIKNNLNNMQNKEMYLFTLLLLATIAITSCNPSSKKEFTDFPITIEMSEFPYVEQKIENCFNPYHITIHDTTLIIHDTRDVNMFLKFYSTSSFNLLSGFGIEGRGPNEYINPYHIKIFPEYNTLWFVETPKKKMHKFDLSEILNNFYAQPQISFNLNHNILGFLDYYQITDSTILVNATTTDALFTEIDSNGTAIKKYGKNNHKLEFQKQFTYNQFYKNFFAVSDTTAVLAYLFHNKLSLYNFKTDVVTDIKGYNYQSIFPEITETGNISNNYRAFSSKVIQYREHFLVLYMGSPFFDFETMTSKSSKTMLVFDKNLIPKCKIKFPLAITNYTISADGKIYIIPDAFDGRLFIYDLEEIFFRI